MSQDAPVSTASFGKYRPIAELGHGGMADVFLTAVASPESLGFSKLVVVKRLRANLIEDQELVKMLIDEARIASRLNHPNVIQTIEVGRVEGQYLLAMEYLEGQPLSRVRSRARDREGSWDMNLYISILVDVLAGLHYAHELKDYDGLLLNVVHRDISPQNIFVTYEGQVKVLDFGVAKAERRISQTRQGMVKGKLQYMAPEQARGKPVDRRADLFSVGVLLWEAVTGKRFWPKEQSKNLMQRLVSLDFDPSPRSVDPTIPERLDAIVRKALAKNVDERYANALDLQADLDKYLGTRHVSNRKIGAYVTALFAEERETLRQVIDNQLKELATEPTNVRTISLWPHGGTPSSQSLSLADSSVSGTSNTSQCNDPPTVVEPSVATQASPVPTPITHAVLGGPHPAAGAPASTPQTSLRGTMMWMATLVVGLCVTSVVAYRMGQNGTPAPPQHEPQPTTSAQVPAASATASSSPSRPGMFRVTISSDPKEATISVDDQKCAGNPCELFFPPDGRTHTARASAPDHMARVRDFVVKGDVVLDLGLTRLGK